MRRVSFDVDLDPERGDLRRAVPRLDGVGERRPVSVEKRMSSPLALACVKSKFCAVKRRATGYFGTSPATLAPAGVVSSLIIIEVIAEATGGAARRGFGPSIIGRRAAPLAAGTSTGFVAPRPFIASAARLQSAGTFRASRSRAPSAPALGAWRLVVR